MSNMYYLLCYDFKYEGDKDFGDRIYSDCAAGETVIEAWNHFLDIHKDSGKTYRLLGARPDIYPDNIADTAQWSHGMMHKLNLEIMLHTLLAKHRRKIY